MKRYSPFLLCFLLLPDAGSAQTPADTTAKPWNQSLVGSVALSQVAFKDWAQGGESALAWTLNFDGTTARIVPRFDWTTSYKTAFGQTRQGSRGFRKTDDKIDLETVLIYKMGTYVNPFISTTLKTQFAKGVQYDDTGNGVDVSQFFDPAYLTQSIGAGYQPIPQFKTRLGLALRETVTRQFVRFSDDLSTPQVEKLRVQGGFESVTNIQWNLASNIIFTGKFEAFLDPDKARDPVLRSDSTLVMKINRVISTNINVQILKDSQSSPDTQIKQALAIGLSYSLL